MSFDKSASCLRPVATRPSTTLSFSDSNPEAKIKFLKKVVPIIKKVLPIAQKVITIAGVIVS
jgi:hypothetical protein